MAKFKVGDRVCDVSSIAQNTATVIDLDARGRIKVKWDKSDDDGVCFWSIDGWEKITSPAIRTVTRREIVPGYIDLPNGTEMYIDTQDGEVSVQLEELWLDADSLREAAHLFNQLAEVLDEQTVGGKPAATVAKDNDWIEWHGGKCPVDEETEVEVEWDGKIGRGQAFEFAWWHDGAGDITAYRVLS